MHSFIFTSKNNISNYSISYYKYVLFIKLKTKAI